MAPWSGFSPIPSGGEAAPCLLRRGAVFILSHPWEGQGWGRTAGLVPRESPCRSFLLHLQRVTYRQQWLSSSTGHFAGCASLRRWEAWSAWWPLSGRRLSCQQWRDWGGALGCGALQDGGLQAVGRCVVRDDAPAWTLFSWSFPQDGPC